MTEKTLQQLESFIKKKLPELLSEDLHKLRLIKEADVECCAYMHIRKFIGIQSGIWKVLARKHVSQTGHFVDLLIFKNTTPRIAIELKYGPTKISQKDETSLNKALAILGVNKAYWISVTPKRKSRKDIDSKPTKKSVMHYCLVGLDTTMTDGVYIAWKRKRNQFRRNIRDGKGKAKEDR